MARLGILDLTAAALVGVAFLLPGREFLIEPAVADASDGDLRSIARAQAHLLATPGDGEAATELADLLRGLDLHQEALRSAGYAAERGGGWRALLAVASLHADRVEVDLAYKYAEQALAACDATPGDCPAADRLRLAVYVDGIKAGLKSGVDPRLEPERFREEVLKAFPTVRFKNH